MTSSPQFRRKQTRGSLADEMRILINEGIKESTAIQEDAMDDAVLNYEQEDSWNTMFDTDRTFGERISDGISRVGGSWKFVIGLAMFIFSWAMFNRFAPEQYQWDPYPFILLNLMLSMVAAFQAPIIMMSQNRAADKDRAQADYVGKFVLRSENGVRRLDAKMDLLLSKQWKRIMEAQMIQMRMLEALDTVNHRLLGDHSNAIVVVRDEHLLYLLRRYYGDIKHEFVFSHRHSMADNFYGLVGDIRIIWNDDIKSVQSVTYTLTFPDDSVTLDDIIVDEPSITLRNEFDIPSMVCAGHFARITPYFLGDSSASPSTYTEDNIPERLQHTFSLRREDRIALFWRRPISKLILNYVPPLQFCKVKVHEGESFLGLVRSSESDDGCSMLAKKYTGVSADVTKEMAFGTYSPDWFDPRTVTERIEHGVYLVCPIQGKCKVRQTS